MHEASTVILESVSALLMWLFLSGVLFGLLYFGGGVLEWLRFGAGRGVALGAILKGRIRGVPPRVLVRGMRIAHEGGLSLTPREIELIYLAGGDVFRSVTALLAAKKADLDFSYKKLSALAFEGRDPLTHVQHLLRVRDTNLQNEACGVSSDAVADLVGNEGVVEFAVSPPGIVRVNGVRISAVSDGGYIDKGRQDRIIATRGNVAVVEQL